MIHDIYPSIHIAKLLLLLLLLLLKPRCAWSWFEEVSRSNGLGSISMVIQSTIIIILLTQIFCLKLLATVSAALTLNCPAPFFSKTRKDRVNSNSTWPQMSHQYQYYLEIYYKAFWNWSNRHALCIQATSLISGLLIFPYFLRVK